MSVQEALRFIEALGADLRLREQLRGAGRAVELDGVAALAADAGFDVTADDLQQAFVHDWRMRRRFYSARGLREADDDESAS